MNVGLIRTPFLVKFTGRHSCNFPVDSFDLKFTGTRSCKFPVESYDLKFTGIRSCKFPVESYDLKFTGTRSCKCPVESIDLKFTGTHSCKIILIESLNTFCSSFLLGSSLTIKMLKLLRINSLEMQIHWPTL